MTTHVTLSFDDGPPSDLRLASLLKECGLKATFYVPLANPEGPLMTPATICQLADMGFELGSHGLSHERLHRMGELEARRELFLSKQRLERLLGKKVRGFCFSGGKYHGALPVWVAQEGYDYCRTTRMFRRRRMRRHNVLHTSIQWYPHRTSAYLRNLTRRPSLGAALEFFKTRARDFETTARAVFDQAIATGCPFHLWGHSHDLESEADWSRLTRFLEYIGTRSGVQYCDNGELFDALVH